MGLFDDLFDRAEAKQNATPAPESPASLENKNENETVETTENKEGVETPENEQLGLISYIAETHGLELPEKEYDFGTYTGMAEFAGNITKAAQDKFESTLSQLAPRAYQALIYELSGKNPAELFTNANYDLPIAEDDQETQIKIIRADMKAKGLLEDAIDDLIEAWRDKKDDTLYKKALQINSDNKKRAIEEMAEKVKQEENAKKEIASKIQTVATDIKTKLTNGTIGNVIVPEKDRSEFFNFVAKSLQYDDKGNILLQLPYENEKTLNALYFMFKGGNLDTLINNRTKTVLSKKIINDLNNAKTEKKSSLQETFDRIFPIK